MLGTQLIQNLFDGFQGLRILGDRPPNFKEKRESDILLANVIWPLVAAIIFFSQYRKLGHLKEAIVAMDHASVKEASVLCKQLFKSKVKKSADIAEASSRRCRMRLMTDSVFCAQRNLARAFYMNRVNFQGCIADLNRKKLRVVVRHPLGKLTYAFDKTNSAKIKNWLSAPTAQTS